ncbi:hypothetical protein LTR08_000322 [Meristemomyces frigidus]|nr:hypothetical protein LTR08_000322 [Meristemomyces frigidus]
MSSMRNAVHRRNHKERAQPLERQKWGLLEKHKDYSKRAADHNLKKRKLSTLRHKAEARNEDEFYFGMMSSTTKGGVKRSRRGEGNGGGGEEELGHAVVRLMKTQDEGYLRTMLQSTRRMRERVGEEVVVGEMGVAGEGPAGGKRRVVFDEDGVAQPARQNNTNTNNDDDDDDADDDEMIWSDEEADSAPPGPPLSKPALAARRRTRTALATKQRHHATLRDREAQLGLALRRVSHQRGRMSNIAGGVNKSGVQFKQRERKR